MLWPCTKNMFYLIHDKFLFDLFYLNILFGHETIAWNISNYWQVNAIRKEEKCFSRKRGLCKLERTERVIIKQISSTNILKNINHSSFFEIESIMQLQTLLKNKNGEKRLYSLFICLRVCIECMFVLYIFIKPPILPIWKGEKDNPVCHHVELWRALCQDDFTRFMIKSLRPKIFISNH